MKLFGVDSEESFHEFSEVDFSVDFQEALLEEWLNKNPEGILEDGKVFVFGRQVRTSFDTFIDLLGMDREGNLIVIELKRSRTPRDTIAQALEYASFAKTLDYEQLEGIFQTYQSDPSVSLKQWHKGFFDLSEEEGVSFNKEQRLVIVGQKITSPIRQTAIFLNDHGVMVTCVEFTFFQTQNGERLFSIDTLIASQSEKGLPIQAGRREPMDCSRFFDRLDESIKPVAQNILALAELPSFGVRWTATGFTLFVDIDGMSVPFCSATTHFNGEQVSSVVLSTYFSDSKNVHVKTNILEEEIQERRKKALNIPLFEKSGKRDVCCSIEKGFNQEEVNQVVSFFRETGEWLLREGAEKE